MTYRDRNVQRFDRMFWRMKPRPQKWSSVAVVALASIVFFLCLTTDRAGEMSMALGLIGSFGAIAAAIRQMGPLRNNGLAGTEDERENLWRSQCQTVGFAVVAIGAMVGMIGAALALLFFNLPRMTVTGSIEIDALPVALRLIAFAQYLFVLLIIVPTLHASWTLPPPVDHEDFAAGRTHFGKRRVLPG